MSALVMLAPKKLEEGGRGRHSNDGQPRGAIGTFEMRPGTLTGKGQQVGGGTCGGQMRPAIGGP